MIIEEYDKSLFISRFEDYNRVETKKNPNGNFSYRGLRFLFEYLDENSEEENPLKLDVVALCCEFSEYKDLNSYLQDYKTDITKEDFDKNDDLEGYEEAVFNEINEKTILIKFDEDDKGFIIAQF